MLDQEYVDDVERLAWEVVNAAYDEYGSLRGIGEQGSHLQQQIVRLAYTLRHCHYDGDGCLDTAD